VKTAKNPSWLWACRHCRKTFSRDECAVRLGQLECPVCLPRHHLVGLLEPAARQPYCPSCACSCWERFGGCTGCGTPVEFREEVLS
jgi:hypothetical protein